jgi:hypothetical protein
MKHFSKKDLMKTAASVATAAMCFGLAACDESDFSRENSDPIAPVLTSQQEDGPGLKYKVGPHFGPHYDFNSGEIQIYSTSPGMIYDF